MKNTALLCILGLALASAEILKPAKWSFEGPKVKSKVGDTVTLTFIAKIEKNWYLYSSELKVEGPTPTEITFTPNASYQTIGKIEAINPKVKHDAIWGGNVHYFIKEAKFTQKVKILKPNAIIEGKINCQTCTDTDGKCIPIKEKFKFEL